MDISKTTDILLAHLFETAAKPNENEQRSTYYGVSNHIVSKAIALLKDEGFETFLQQTGEDALFNVIAMRNYDTDEEVAIVYPAPEIASLVTENGNDVNPQMWRVTKEQMQSGEDVEPSFVADYVTEKTLGIRQSSTGFKFSPAN